MAKKKLSELPLYPGELLDLDDEIPVNSDGTTYRAPVGALPFPTLNRFTAEIDGAGTIQETGVVQLSRVAVLLKLVSTGKMRLRLYTTAVSRDADLARAIGVAVPQNSGLLFEGVTNDLVLSFDATPVPTLVNGEATPTNFFAYTVDPDQATPFTITLTCLELQP